MALIPQASIECDVMTEPRGLEIANLFCIELPARKSGGSTCRGCLAAWGNGETASIPQPPMVELTPRYVEGQGMSLTRQGVLALWLARVVADITVSCSNMNAVGGPSSVATSGFHRLCDAHARPSW